MSVQFLYFETASSCLGPPLMYCWIILMPDIIMVKRFLQMDFRGVGTPFIM